MTRRKRTDNVVEEETIEKPDLNKIFEEELAKNPATVLPDLDVQGEIQKLYGPLGQGNVTGILMGILSELVRDRLERRNHG